MEMLAEYEETMPLDMCPDVCSIIKEPYNGYVLEIRKFYALKDEKEYRCFIRDSKLIGVSQRNLYIINCEPKDDLERIKNYCENVKIPLNSFVLDIYLDLNAIILVDINPWQEHTRPKLFTFEELEKLEEFEFRTVKCKDEIM